MKELAFKSKECKNIKNLLVYKLLDLRLFKVNVFDNTFEFNVFYWDKDIA